MIHPHDLPLLMAGVRAGLLDPTYGVASTLPWARDFGDGIARHPVQLYESASMALVLFAVLWGFARRAPLIITEQL